MGDGSMIVKFKSVSPWGRIFQITTIGSVEKKCFYEVSTEPMVVIFVTDRRFEGY